MQLEAGDAVTEEKLVDLEDSVQIIIAAASSPPTFQNDLSSVSSSELIKLIGAGNAAGFGSNERPPRLQAPVSSRSVGSHAVPTVLLVQKRLSEEFRHLCAVIQDQYEVQVEMLKKEYESLEKTIRAAHLDKLRRILDEDTGEVDPQGAAAAAGTIKVQATASVELLEQKILNEAESSADGGDVRTKRLTTFWKSRYQSTARKLSEEQQKLIAAEAKMAEQVMLNGSDPSSLSQLLQSLRDVEAREKEKLLSARSHYVRECQRQGVAPKEVPETSPPLGAGRAVESLTSHADAKTFTLAGSKSSSVRLLAVLLAEKMSQAESAAQSAAEYEGKISRLQQQLDAMQTSFCAAAGGASGNLGQLLEEVVHLRAEVELRDSHRYGLERRALADRCAQRRRISQLRMEMESARCKLKERMNAKRKELSDLEVQLFQIRHGGGGDVHSQSELQLLRSKVAVLENELTILKNERADLQTLSMHVKNAVDGRVPTRK